MASEIISPGALQRLAESDVFVSETKELTAYLAKYPQLAQLLPSICGEVRRTLGADVELSLELYADPEIEDCYLALYVRKEKYEPDILQVLQVASEKFNPSLEDKPGYFLLTTDFSPPRGRHGI